MIAIQWVFIPFYLEYLITEKVFEDYNALDTSMLSLKRFAWFVRIYVLPSWKFLSLIGFLPFLFGYTASAYTMMREAYEDTMLQIPKPHAPKDSDETITVPILKGTMVCSHPFRAFYRNWTLFITFYRYSSIWLASVSYLLTVPPTLSK